MGTHVAVEDHVLLEDDDLLQHAAGDVVLGGALGQEPDVYTAQILVDVVAHGALCALALERGVERPESVELHAVALGDNLDEAVAEGGEHAQHRVARVRRAVVGNVGGHAAHVERVLAVALGKPQQVALVGRVVHLPQVVEHGKFAVCHSCKVF